MTFLGNKHTSFYILFAILIIFLFARYAFQYDVPRYALSIVIMLMALFGDQDEILAALMCCIPLHNAVNFSITLIVCATIYMLKNIQKLNFGFSTVIILLMVVYELLHANIGSFQPLFFFADMAPLFVLLAVMSVDLKGIGYAFIVRTMAVILVSLGMTLIVNNIINTGSFFSVVTDMQRLGIIGEDVVVYGAGINPNTLGILNVLAICSLLQVRLIGRYIRVDSILIVFLLVFGILTVSRTFFVCFLFMGILFVFGQAGEIQNKIVALLKMSIVIIISLIVIGIFFPETLEYFIMRFIITDVTTITTSRDILMYDYYHYIANNLGVMLFGVGLNDFAEKVLNIYMISTHTPHNSILEIIAAWGIVGLILVLLLLVAIIIDSKSHVNIIIVNYIPLYVILLKSMAGQLLTSGYSMLAMSFVYLSLCQDFTKKKLENKSY